MTFEITTKMWTAARYVIQKAIKGRAYKDKIRKLKEQKALMIVDRLAGMTCPELAVKYRVSLHMARYYTRLPRSKVYFKCPPNALAA